MDMMLREALPGFLSDEAPLAASDATSDVAATVRDRTLGWNYALNVFALEWAQMSIAPLLDLAFATAGMGRAQRR